MVSDAMMMVLMIISGGGDDDDDDDDGDDDAAEANPLYNNDDDSNGGDAGGGAGPWASGCGAAVVAAALRNELSRSQPPGGRPLPFHEQNGAPQKGHQRCATARGGRSAVVSRPLPATPLTHPSLALEIVDGHRQVHVQLVNNVEGSACASPRRNNRFARA